jgi:antitoxin FitA
MASLTVRDLDDDTKERLRVLAAESGQSMEAHVRRLIESAVNANLPTNGGYGTWIQSFFTHPAELVIEPRTEMAEPMTFAK